MQRKRLLVIPPLVYDRGNTVYPFLDFPVLGPVPPTVCDALQAIFAYIKPRVRTLVYRLGDEVLVSE